MNFMLMTSTMMVFMKHPLSLGFTILTHTILTCMIMGMMSMNYWFSYILILVMIGGLLVLFIYMTSIASNEKFKFNNYILIMITMMILMTLIAYYKSSEFMMYTNLNNELLTQLQQNNDFKINMTKFLNYPNSNMFMLIIFYLLIAMIAIVKITKLNFGPLRQIK
uniref:NADH-ubiquinone oxidoreductase chain 6 n=1 Tax=Halyziini sp. HA TaxID=2511224 RepID=A0A411DAL3_9CUCU|nr:NADH dehydrogenase subunit 6 [Halyziini sp. HA]